METVSGETRVEWSQTVERAERTSALLTWWVNHPREVAWRTASDPWIVLVAEVMSQQTQLDRVNQRLPLFISQFPTPAALAAAGRADVLAAWSGLGYNNRALRLQDAARHLNAHGWPGDSVGLRALPGVGPYTAAAVASLVWGEAVPAIDTNHRRVLSRWVGRPLDGTELDAVAWSLIHRDRPADWNQAVMDLAQAICRPVPNCEECPVVGWCADPSIYVAPAAQPVFQGSLRQARGAILRSLVDSPHSFDALLEKTSLPVDRLRSGLASLVDEDVVAQDGDRWQIVD